MKSTTSVCDVARFPTYETMDPACESRPRKCTLDQNDCVSLLDILISFNAPINEEHAWALCYQCAKCFKNAFESDRSSCKVVSDLERVILHREGYVHPNTIFSGGGTTPEPAENSGGSRLPGPPEHKVVAGLGLVVFKALDFGLEDEEERHLHPELDQLLQDMTRCGLRQMQHAETDDEGIERDSGDSEDDLNHNTSLDQVLQYCGKHVPQPAESHYRAVCRALVAEALELSSFLDKVSEGKVKTETVSVCTDLQSLHVADWARLWVQVIRELRHGVQLKKVSYSRTPIEYELTPYEILMDDIRSRRYKLNKVMVNGNIPKQVRKDAHAVILEFIRSRPPLRKASDRKLPPKPCRTATPRDRLLESIKQGHAKLRPSPSPLKKKVVPFDDADQPDSTPSYKAQTRRLIKVDFSALQMDDDDEDVAETSDGELERTPRPNPWQRTGTTPCTSSSVNQGPLTRDEYHHYCDQALECTRPVVTQGCSIL